MPDLAHLIPMFLLLLAIGAFAGVISGLLGVGGGIILVPAFFYAFTALGYGSATLMRVCIATSLATIIVTSLRSAHGHNKRGAVDWVILRGWGPGIVVGAVLGVWAVSRLQTTALQAIFGSLSLVVAFYLGFGRSDWRFGAQMPTGIRRVILSPLMG
ncbi:MAG: sulfite exporter TauE/SafE family protein, partial [Rhodobacteraceae bacterium]|nr:sulfite exporter TauE/SafE family protein [Paracoccaceae bacterium]